MCGALGKRSGRGALALAGAALLGACTTVGPDFERPGMPAALAGWDGGSLASLDPRAGAQGSASVQQWWRSFDDAVLDALIAEAQRVNPTVRAAGLRIMEARAELGIAGSTLYPQGQQFRSELLRVGQRRAGGPDSTLTDFNTSVDISWELDFWGKFKRGIEAADAGYLASIARYDDVQVLMAAQVASLYYTILTTEARLAIARDNAALQLRSLQITELLFRGGNEAELDVQQARTLYLGTLATIPPLEIGLRQAQNALSTLLARAPGPLPEMNAREEGRHTMTRLPVDVAADLITELPADLLRRRPDVRAVEMQLAAQSALIGVSAAELYPSISLLGSVGLSATSLDGAPRVLNWALGSGLLWNVFDHGRLNNGVLVQDARFQQLYEQYQGAVLNAAREVDDAAAGFARTGAQIVLLADGVKAAQRSLDIASFQYREGLTDFQRVLDSQRVLYSQQELLATTRGSLVQNLIALYKAMGGGWEQGRSRPPMDEATRAVMERRSDWKDVLRAPLPAPGGEHNP
ncbi:efflux transporter outer membrane subunit [Massilia timonae]|uniref:Efflux transporter, outer membrane factor (OMF) lipo, NodT family protein n=1 Tax=Massilia timonae TaxID=47229 RepID=A0A1S2NH77_9BURK|nr:efflux transporter outer membrane subunit [Massilia timonae]OIJ44446.1 efflux transporter, outer membrane factor (OMF) lipo, NodT family protein [Massilia timonae]